MKKSFFRFVLVLIAFTLNYSAIAADYFWVNGSGNWNNSNHWSLNSGGLPNGSTPGTGDNVIFDENSFPNGYGDVLLTENQSINQLTISSSTAVNIHGQQELTLSGGFEATTAYNINLHKIKFENSSNLTHNLNFNDVSISADIHFVDGNWNLNSKLITSWQNEIHFEDGQFTSNGHPINSNKIIANQSNYKFKLTNSVVYAVEEINLSKAVDKGNGADFWTNLQEVNTIEKGGFSGSTFTKDQVFLCDNGTLTVEIITLDYNGGVQVSCNDSCDGELTINVSGSPGPYLYNFDNQGFVANNFYTGLCADNYLITVQDLSNEIGPPGSGIFYQCSVQELLQPPTELQLTLLGSTPESCPGACDGTIFSDAVGGTSPYTVTWSPSMQITENPVNLCQGLNLATVVDDNGCTIDTSFTVPGPPNFTANATITEPTCNGDCDGEIDVTPGGANGGPYTFSWAPVPTTSGQGSMPGIGFCAGTLPFQYLMALGVNTTPLL